MTWIKEMYPREQVDFLHVPYVATRTHFRTITFGGRLLINKQYNLGVFYVLLRVYD